MFGLLLDFILNFESVLHHVNINPVHANVSFKSPENGVQRFQRDKE